jgi:SOS-response transcriptional repressor LexA
MNKYKIIKGAQGLHNALVILEYIRDYNKEHNTPPTIQNIADTIGYKSTGSVWPYIQMLENEGYILRNGKRKRYTLLKP